MELWGFVS